MDSGYWKHCVTKDSEVTAETGVTATMLYLCDMDTEQGKAALMHHICNLSIIKKAKEDVGYVCFEKHNKAQFFYFNELQCLYLGI